MQQFLRTLAIVAAMLLPFASQAQLSAVYEFSTGVDNSKWYTLTSDSVVLIDASSFATSTTSTSGDSKKTDVTNIGFTFNFAGVDYTQFSANSDGTVRLGATQIGTSGYSTPFSTSNASVDAPKICGLGCDGCMVLGDYIAYQLFGTEGDHVLVIEISTGTYNSTTRGNHYTFQVQLAEADNSVTVVYSPTAPADGPNASYQLGASAGANDIVLYDVTAHTISALTAGVSTSNAAGTWPEAGRYYTMTPNPNACFPVTGLAIDATLTTNSSLTLTWADTSNSAASYEVYSITATDTISLGTATTTIYTVSGLDANTVYEYGVVADCGSGNLANMVTIAGRTACNATSPLPYSENFSGYTGLHSYPYYGPSVIPGCWDYYGNGTNTAETSGTSAYFGGVAQYSGTSYGSMESDNPYLCLYIQVTSSSVTNQTYLDYQTARGNTRYAVLPAFDEALNTLQISFDYKMSSAYSATGAATTLEFGYITTDTASFVSLQQYQAVTSTQHVDELSLATLAAAAPAGARLAFKFSGVHNGTGSYSYSSVACGIDNIVVEELPSCFHVTDLVVSAATASSMTLTWSDDVNTGATYTVSDADGVIASGITAMTYTVENLDANTEYTFSVVANCSASDASEAESISGRTACSSISIDVDTPYTENFDSYTVSVSGTSAPTGYPNTVLPNCWSFLNMSDNTSSYPQVFMTSSTTYAASGNCLFFKSSSTTPLYAVMPEFEATGALQLVFDYRNEGTTASNGTILVGVMTNASDASTFVALDSCERTTTITNHETVIPESALVAGARVAFCYRGGTSNNYYASVDNVIMREAPSCLPVVGLAVSNITAHTATLTWQGDADGYTIWDMSDTSVYEYADDTTVVLYALDGETAYTFGVTSSCGSLESDMRTVSFTTLVSCPAPANLAAVLTPGDGTVATLNWNAGGEESEWQLCLNGDMTNPVSAYDSTYDLTNLTPEQAVTAKVRAICGVGDTSAWSSEISFTPTNAFTVTVNDGTTTNSYVPVYGNWVDNITKSQFIIPAADLSAMAYGSVNKLTFYSSDANKNWGAATFEVYLAETSETSVSALADYTTMTQVYSGSLSIVNNVMEITLTTPYQYTGGNLMVGFLQTVSGTYSNCNWYGVTATGASMGGYGSSISQRNFLPKTTFDFTPGEEPSCLPVSGLAVSDIATDEATLSWTGDASSYNVYIVTATDTTFDQSVSGNTVTLTGLTPMTSYTYGVRSACGTDESDIRVVTFNTACAPVTLPYTETFASTSATRNCWNLVSNNTANVGGDNGAGFVTVSGRETMRFSSYSNASDYNQYGFSPMLTVSDDATNLQVKVVYATYGSNDKLRFGYVTATDTVWDPTEYTTTGNSDWQSQTFIVPTTATQLAAHYYGSFSYYAWIDSVEVVEMTPSFCYPVTNLAVDSVSATSVYLSWADTNNGGATYSVYAADGTVLATGLTATSYEVTGLTASTAYTFGVSADCSADNSSTVASIAATTDCVGGSCLITIAGTDAYGDGWDGAMITVSQNGATVGTFTVDAASNTATYSVCSGAPVTFSWTVSSSSYAYPDDISFTITDGGGATVYSLNDATNMTDGVFFTLADACPSCIMPVLTLDSVTTTTATISWTSTAASFNVYNGTTAVATGISANTYTFTGLTAGTAYTFGVVALCSADDTSAMATVNAQTEFDCSDITTLPYTYGFEGALGCWTTVNGSADGQPWSVYPGITNTLPHSGNYVASSWSWQSTAMNADAWLISPKFVLPTVAAGDSLTFAWWEASNASYPDSYSVAVSTTTNDTASFVTVRPSTVAAGTWTMQSIDLTAYAGQSIYVAFHHVDYDANYIFIDDVSLTVGAAPMPEPDSMMVTIAVNDATMGTTIPAPGVHYFYEGDTASIVAVPNTGYNLSGWTFSMTYNGQTIYNDTTLNIPATDFFDLFDQVFVVEPGSHAYTFDVTANFTAEPINDSVVLTVAVNDATMGTTTPAPGTYSYHNGDALSLVATPNAGYALSAWQFSLTINGEALYTNEVVSSASLGVQIPSNFFDIFQNLSTVTPNIYGAVFDVTAIFAADSSVVEPDSAIIITAVNDATMGTISPAPGTHVYYDGDVFSITATPNAGYHLDSWVTEVSYMGQVLSTDTIPAFPGLFDSLDAELYLGMTMSVTAIFAPGQQFDSLVVTTSVNNAEWGTITPAPGTHYYTVGDEVSFDVQPNDGYYLYSLQVSMSAFGETFDTVFTSYEDFVAEMDSVLVVEEVMLGATISIHANFQPNGVTPEEYTVTVNYNATMGNVLVNGQAADNGSTITVTEGSSVSFTANAYNNYEFVAWVDNGDTVGRETIYTINAIDATHSVTAVFREKVGIADVELDNVDIYSVDSRIYVRGAEGKQVYLFDVNGRLMSREANAAESVEFRVSNSGVYLVKVGNAAAKRVVVIR